MADLAAAAAYQLVARTEAFVVINKASGISVHRDGAVTGLVEQVERDLGLKLWLVHRLDRITSGLLLLATSAPACERLAALFRDRQIEKYYLALCDRKPSKKQGRVVGDMARSRRGSWASAAQPQQPGQHRISQRIRRFWAASAAVQARQRPDPPDPGGAEKSGCACHRRSHLP